MNLFPAAFDIQVHAIADCSSQRQSAVPLIVQATEPLRYTFDAEVESASPLVAGVLTGSSMDIIGRGFNPSFSYTCQWSMSHTQFAQAVIINSSFISCRVPYWHGRAGNSSLTLRDASGRAISTKFPLYFHHFAQVNASEPTHTNGGVPFQVTIIGAGFDPFRFSASYKCALGTNVSRQVIWSELAEAQEYWSIVCKFSDSWQHGAARSNISLFDTMTKSFVPTVLNEPIPLIFLQQILRIEPTCSNANMDVKITIFGRGFSPSAQYSLMLQQCPADFGSSSEAGKGDGIFVASKHYSSHFQWQSAQRIVFEVPPWPHAAGLVLVKLVMNGIEDSNAGRLNFSITEALTVFEPRSGLVYGSMLLVRGFGFIPQPIYRCNLASLTNASQYLLSDPVTPYSTTMLECVFHFWPYQAQELNFTLFRDGIAIQFAGESLSANKKTHYKMLEAWLATTMLHRLSSAGGQMISVFGGGFHQSEQPNYQCRWLVEPHALLDSTPWEPDVLLQKKGIVLSSPATAKSPDTVLCRTPFFLSDSGSAVISLWHAVSKDDSYHEIAYHSVQHQQVDSENVMWQKVHRVYLPEESARIAFGGGPILHPVDGGLNGPIGGHTVIMMHGENLGYIDFSPRVRIGGTACELTKWIAGSHLKCLTPAKVAEELSNALIITLNPLHISTA